jgi:hypothetical protein
MSYQKVSRWRRSHYSGGILTARQQRRSEAAQRRRQEKKEMKARQGRRPQPLAEGSSTRQERTGTTETTPTPTGGLRECQQRNHTSS